ncbi:DUF4430 domain-containing protein [Isoptericola sp. AK164]|uniref:DUF4430 domain-containing protein n=1 Tax=Isoptericola sp. AK164 TaxID=3024246 RepID=UPI002418AAD2|nr:DUF4430 domain-containing protein [Isoptericola sp. AK164]
MKIVMRTTSTRLLSAAAAGALSVGLLAACGQDDTPAADPADTSASVTATQETSDAEDSADAEDAEESSEDVTELTYPGQDGETALDLLLEADPEAEVTGEGDMAYVTGIQGHAADEDEFWALSVDGEMAQVGAGSLETEDGQEIQWKLEEIEE